MYEIKVSLQLFKGVTSGMRSSLILDESQHYLVNDKVVLVSDNTEVEGDTSYAAICSVNSITPSDEINGLKKGFALVCLSVVSLQ